MITSLIVVFIIGYVLIALEHQIHINKAAIALVTGAVCWTILIMSSPDKGGVNESLTHHLGDLSGILFFLLGAMVIVELIDAHDGFDILTNRIHQVNKIRLLWIVALISFLLSAMLDNLTTTIVMGALLRKLIAEEKDRIYFMGIVVISANAGGAWSPIGDVTTTMLWIGGQISSLEIMKALIFPSLICMLTPLLYLSFRMKGVISRPQKSASSMETALPVRQQTIVFFTGLLVLIFVPIFKTVTHLPPYLGILFGLGILWIVTEVMHGNKDEEDKHQLSVAYALRKIDTPSILFFFGILVSIASLESAGVLQTLSVNLTQSVNSTAAIGLLMGLLSAVIDNVPLVAAVQAMFSLDVFPQDHAFWHFLAYTTGTGGSLLIIGSAAGVAAMGLEKISFLWYLKAMSLLALLGYLSGAIFFLLQHNLQ